MKATLHKSCHCHMCNMGRTAAKRNANERKFRRSAKRRILDFLRHNDFRNHDVFLYPISSPYTD